MQSPQQSPLPGRNSGSSGSNAGEFLMSLTLKEAEVVQLKQQLTQSADELRRQQDENARLTNTISALNGVVGEKDRLFNEFKGEVVQLEVLREQDARRAADAERQLADQQAAFTAKAAAREVQVEADLAALRAALRDTEERAAAQVRDEYWWVLAGGVDGCG